MNPETHQDADVIVVGAGASGMMAAGRAAECGARVLLLEKMDTAGKKILVSGKTRCNLTNTADLKKFISMYGPNGRFLYSAFSRFFRPELLDFLGRYGVATKTERGGRVFPVSDNARDVVRAFRNYLEDHFVHVVYQAGVQAVTLETKAGFRLQTQKKIYRAPVLILATGGASWPKTGSTGDGYAFAESLGHTLVELKPALVPLIVEERTLAKSLQDVVLRNVRATAFRGTASSVDVAWIPALTYGRGEKKTPRPPVIESRLGEMLFTHFGLGGPMILQLSLAVVQALREGPVSILIDLKPAVPRQELRKRLMSDLNQFGKRPISIILKDYLPSKMIFPLTVLAKVDPSKPAHQISAAEREKLLDVLKALRFNIQSSLPLAQAIVTAGGVALDEIDPRTLASKKVSGLFFCGEILDLDADTGGYNLQAAFSTGYVAGESAARYLQS